MLWGLWVLGGVALLVVGILVAALWFDRLFEAATATTVPSLVDHFQARSVLAVFAHPDDETLAAGALADAGRRDAVEVCTITLTRGENGYPEPPICRREDLPLVREAELRRYGFVLGIGHQELWGYPDGGLGAHADDPDLLDRLVEQIRKHRPDLIVTFDPEGGYTGHLDHRATGAITTRAVRLALDAAYKPQLGEPHCPKCVVYMLAPTRAFQTLGGRELRGAAARQPRADLAVPVASSLRTLGWRIHESQHLPAAYPLPGWLLFYFWDKEHYAIRDPRKL